VHSAARVHASPRLCVLLTQPFTVPHGNRGELMTGPEPASSREIARVKSAATRAVLLPVVDLAGYLASSALWLARAAAHVEVAAASARRRRHAVRPVPAQEAGAPEARAARGS